MFKLFLFIINSLFYKINSMVYNYIIDQKFNTLGLLFNNK